MRYDPKSEVDNNLLPDGEYEAVVMVANEKVSQTGNEMIEIMLEVYRPDGGKSSAFDYLVSSAKTLWKVRQFCESAGIDYMGGQLEADELVNLNVRVALVTEEQKGYRPKNKVVEYLLRNGKTPVAAGAGPPAHGDEDLPEFLR